MFVLSREPDVEKFERSVALQNEYGLASRMLTAGEARELCPLVQGDDILAGAFSPGDGHATPEGVVQGYAFAARAHGAETRVNCEVLDIKISGGAEITEVVTDHGSIRTSTVICAAGAWSRSCGAMVGLDLPVTPLRRQILFTEAMDGLPAQIPMTIDFESSFYFHREGPGLLMGMSDPHEKPGFNVETTDDWIPGLMEVVRRRAPRIADAGIRGGWAGLYEMTPDHNAIIGEATQRLALPLRDRVLRTRIPPGPRRRRDPPRPGLASPAVRRHRTVEPGALRRVRPSPRVQRCISDITFRPELTEQPMTTTQSQQELSVSSTDELRSRARGALENCGVDLSSPGTGPSVSARSPITGEALFDVPAAGQAEVEEAIAATGRAFREWRGVPAPVRGAFVKRLGELLGEHKADVAELVTIEAGKITLGVPRRGAGGHRYLRLRGRALAPARWAHDAVRAPRPPVDGDLAPAGRGRRHHRVQLPVRRCGPGTPRSPSSAETPSCGSPRR